MQLTYKRGSGQFNGSSNNYDGPGRSASNNNTLYILGWINF